MHCNNVYIILFARLRMLVGTTTDQFTFITLIFQRLLPFCQQMMMWMFPWYAAHCLN